MAVDRKIILLSVLFLAGGILFSYRAFFINGEEHKQASTETGEEVTGWVAQNLEYRLLQLESSTSYLDQSTVESLKRLGVRYFAYVYKNQDEWSVKWKELGFLEKEGILEEINEINFNKINSDKKAWYFNNLNELVYITPVGLAKSHQLHEGFLVFGLKEDFFKFINSEESSVIFLTERYKALKGDFPPELESRKGEMDSNQLGMTGIHVKGDGKNLIFTSYFSPFSQLWIVHKKDIPSISYFESLFFYYILISTGLGFLLFLLFGGKFISFSLFKNRESFKDQESVENKEEGHGDIENETSEEILTLDRNSEVLDPFSENQVNGNGESLEFVHKIHAGDFSSKRKEDQSESEEQSSSVKPFSSLKPEDSKKKKKSLDEIEKTVERALEDFQLKNFDFKNSKVDELTFKENEMVNQSPKLEEIKGKLKRDEHGLFEFDNGQFKIKIRPPKKKDGNANY